ncbi:MAG: hypothetical protein IIV17_00715 [Clostridia bacterium]|nr:hypothetical protein [Clostridia bacterium]
MAQQQQKPKIPFRERVYRFMMGRNGTDTLCTALTVCALVLLGLELISGWAWLSIPSLALLIYSNFRAFSRNVVKRRRENAAFCGFFRRIRGFFKLQRNKWKDRKTHIYRKCPSCKSVLRLPRAKGKHTVNCPRCHNRFAVVGR